MRAERLAQVRQIIRCGKPLQAWLGEIASPPLPLINASIDKPTDWEIIPPDGGHTWASITINSPDHMIDLMVR